MVIQDSIRIEAGKEALKNEAALKRELLVALETTRCRLAIAIAEESKFTPGHLRRYYLDTAEHIRQFIEKLRYREDNGPYHRNDWISALEVLRSIPLKEDAQSLCNHLSGIVKAFE